MGNSAEKILYRKAALIFEELGFLMPNSNQGFTSSKSSIGAYIPFSGPFSGCLLLRLNSEALSALSGNMLGSETPSNEAVELDALGEIANVICGNALPAIFGLTDVFHLEAPKSSEPDSTRFESDYSRIATALVPFSCGHAEVVLYAEAKAASFLQVH
jgi:chemotaxis protein CheY-P-specific phosphatase CheC